MKVYPGMPLPPVPQKTCDMNTEAQQSSPTDSRCASADFREAKSSMLKLLLSEYLYKMLFATMDAIENIPVPEPIAEEAGNKVLQDLMDEFFREKGLEIDCDTLSEKVNLVKDAIKKEGQRLENERTVQQRLVSGRAAQMHTLSSALKQADVLQTNLNSDIWRNSEC